MEVIGKKFGRLTVQAIIGKRRCVCICDCGNVVERDLYSVKDGLTRSCGCLRTESNLTGNNRRVHGLRHHPLYAIWCGIKDRCYCKTDKAYDRYGGRGVVMCDDWKNDFMAFFNWAVANGWERGLCLDKDKLSPNRSGMMYSPEYCCFISRQENMIYRSDNNIIEYEGVKKSIAEWSKDLGINRTTISERKRKGYSEGDILSTVNLLTNKNLV